MTTGAPLLEVRGLEVRFPVRVGGRRRELRAVDGVDLEVAAGETLALVGESGCGKSTTARAILRLLRPQAGRIVFEGRDIGALRGRRLKPVRARMQVIFQDPYGSLDPRMTVEQIVAEGLVIHRRGDRADRARKVAALLERVGLDPGCARRYPHEFSGGQRQRIGIARALALDPVFIVCDEAVSALDVSIQAQVLNLLADLQRERGMAYLFIAHDLAVVRHVAHRVAVMYLGRVVETGPVRAVFEAPAHPYTRALLAAIPAPDPRRRKVGRARLEPWRTVGDPPSPIEPPSGCRYRTRCPVATERCAQPPPWIERGAGHFTRCWQPDAQPAATRGGGRGADGPVDL